MKHALTFLAAAALSLTSLNAAAVAPKAAEDFHAPVTTTASTPMPSAKAKAPAAKKHAVKKKKAAKRAHR